MNVESSPPLRHGWGGDNDKREEALKYKEAEKIEIALVPEKYSDNPIPLDLNLLKEMQKQK